jgi:hypothetical protein
MHLLLASYPDPDDDETPLAGAVAKIVAHESNEQFGSGKVRVAVYRSLRAAEKNGTTLWQGDILYGTQLNDTSHNTRMRLGLTATPPPDPIYFPRGPEIDREAHEAAKDDPLLSPADAVRTVLYTHLMKLEAFAGAKLIP